MKLSGAGFFWVNFYVLFYLYVLGIIPAENRLLAGISIIWTLLFAAVATFGKVREKK